MAALKTNIFKSFKEANKFAARHQGDGVELEVDIRDDQDQLIKLQEIVDILVAAGYFRARIKGLSSFDKVIGGMTWCIELCNVDIDVDLLFQENSTIGQKIALTEKIVAVLPKLKCPHVIEPHQIQGLDFAHIYPVVQWLVKRSMENRQEISSFVRSYAINQYKKQFETEPKKTQYCRKFLDNLNKVEDIYRPQRYFKRKTAPPPNVDARVQVTLLEYGLKSDTRGQQTETFDEKDPETEEVDQDIVHYEDLNAEEKENVEKHYASLHSEFRDGSIQTGLKNELQILEERKQLMVTECNKLESLKLVKEKELSDHQKCLQEIRMKQQEADEVLKEIENDKDYNTEKYKEIEKIVKLNDDLKAREVQLKEQYKNEITELQQSLEKVKAAKSDTAIDVSPKLIKEIEEETEKISTLRLVLAKKNRHVYALQRKLDDIPSRAELAQYQKRFIELYNQVSAKHKETKQYFTLYNTLEDTRLYMQKQLSLLNSISENYPEAIRTAKGKDEFITQFQNILESVRQSKMKVSQKLTERRYERDNLSDTLQSLVELQRRYVTALRELAVECRKYESLQAKKQNNS